MYGVEKPDLLNCETFISIQKLHLYTRNLNLEPSGDSKTAFLYSVEMF